MIQAWRAAMAFDGRARLGEVRCPTLVIAGERDDAVPLHHARELHGGIAGSRLAVVTGADHALAWSHPAELARLSDLTSSPGEEVLREPGDWITRRPCSTCRRSCATMMRQPSSTL